MTAPLDDQGAIPDEVADDPARHLTRPGGVPGATVYDRVLGLEFWRLEVERRLHDGVSQFTDIKSEVNRLQPKPRSFTSMLPFLIPVVILAGTMLWQAARYPDRREFDAKLNTVQTDVAAIRLEQAQIAIKLDMILKGRLP
jgi:hypothetical protein